MVRNMHARLDKLASFSPQKQVSGPGAARYPQEPDMDGTKYQGGAGEQAATSLAPDRSAGTQRKKTQEAPFGTGDNTPTSPKIAPSSIMQFPRETPPLSNIIKSLSARENAAMIEMRMQIASSLISQRRI